MAKRKSPTIKPTPESLAKAVEKYEAMFEEISGFFDFYHREAGELKDAELAVAETKAAYESAKAQAQSIRDAIAGTKDALFRFLEPGAVDFLPLFDRMEPADKKKHGEHAAEWRKDPISALKLSPIANKLLIDAEIILVGQLQDMVLAAPGEWWERIDGLTASVAAAIADKLNDFIFRDGDRD